MLPNIVSDTIFLQHATYKTARGTKVKTGYAEKVALKPVSLQPTKTEGDFAQRTSRIVRAVLFFDERVTDKPTIGDKVIDEDGNEFDVVTVYIYRHSATGAINHYKCELESYNG